MWTQEPPWDRGVDDAWDKYVNGNEIIDDFYSVIDEMDDEYVKEIFIEFDIINEYLGDVYDAIEDEDMTWEQFVDDEAGDVIKDYLAAMDEDEVKGYIDVKGIENPIKSKFNNRYDAMEW